MNAAPSPPNPRGRPKKLVDTVDYTIRIPRMQAAYLTFLAEKAGWATSANGVIKMIVAREISRLQQEGFHEKGLPNRIDDSGTLGTSASVD